MTDAKEDIGDCQWQVIFPVKLKEIESGSPPPEAMPFPDYFREFSPSLYMYLIAGL